MRLFAIVAAGAAGVLAAATVIALGGSVLAVVLAVLTVLLVALAPTLALRDLAGRIRRSNKQIVRAVDGAVQRDAAARQEVLDAFTAMQWRLRNDALDDVAQLEAFQQVLRLADIREALPRTRGFPASPDALLVLVDLIRREKPSVYLEFGSGTSTVVAAAAARAVGADTKVVAVDHDPGWAEATRELVARHGLESVVEVRLAPLRPLADDPARRWYDVDVLDDLKDVGVVFIDGPPGNTNPCARQPAREFLTGRFAARAFVVIDDANRPDERLLVEEWVASEGSRSLAAPVCEKGLAVISIDGTF